MVIGPASTCFGGLSFALPLFRQPPIEKDGPRHSLERVARNMRVYGLPLSVMLQLEQQLHRDREYNRSREDYSVFRNNSGKEHLQKRGSPER